MGGGHPSLLNLLEGSAPQRLSILVATFRGPLAKTRGRGDKQLGTGNAILRFVAKIVNLRWEIVPVMGVRTTN